MWSVQPTTVSFSSWPLSLIKNSSLMTGYRCVWWYFTQKTMFYSSYSCHHPSHTNDQLNLSLHSLPNTNPITFINDARWEKKVPVKRIPNHPIQLFMIKDFYIIRAWLWLLIVVFAEMDLPFLINNPQTWRITYVLSKWNRRTTWRTGVRVVGENICHYWAEGLWAVLLQHDQPLLHRSNWLHWECMDKRSEEEEQEVVRGYNSSDRTSCHAVGAISKDWKI